MNPIARMMHRRRPARPMPFRPHVAGPIVSGPIVSGTDNGDTYTDDNDATWTYKVQSGFPAGQVSAHTSSYGGVTTSWFDRPVLPGSDHVEINDWIDVFAGLNKAAYDAGAAAEDAVDTTRPTVKYPPKKSGSTAKTPPKLGPVPSAPPKSTSTGWSYVALVAPPAAGWLFAGLTGGLAGLALGGTVFYLSRRK